MSASTTAHSKIVALLTTATPSMLWTAVYSTHETADLDIPSLSVEVETDTPLSDSDAINQQELVDNRNIRLSIRVHTGYRLGPVDTSEAMQIADEVIRELRENINLSDGYRIFDVSGTAYNVEHLSSGTTGAEINVDIHKVEYYAQS